MNSMGCSRSFQGLLHFFPGLAYCRHLSTVRTHLSALVNTTIVDPDVPCDAHGGLSLEVWEKVLKDSSVRLTQKLPGRGKTVIDSRWRQKASLNMLKTVCVTECSGL